MIVELLCRFTKEIAQEASSSVEEELDILEIVKGGEFDRDKERERLLNQEDKYEYGAMVFNLKDVYTFNSVDDQHTSVRFYNGISFTLKVGYDEFKSIYAKVGQFVINKFIKDTDGK
jgi:hypothetical protein